jgi:hypothetical protein
VIVRGNPFQGATVGTASGAGQRGYTVIVPVDCSASEDVYHEQYGAFIWQRAALRGVTSNVTMTRSTIIKFWRHLARQPGPRSGADSRFQ